MKPVILKSSVCVAALAALCAVPALAAAPAAVGNLTLSRAGDFTELTIPVQSRLLCDHFTESANATRPFRIVLNFCDATHALPRQNFDRLPSSVVQRIRTSQFASTPQPIVRIVLDLSASATYTLRTLDDRLVVSISDPGRAVFAAWQANAAVAPTVAVDAAPTQYTKPAPSTSTSPKATTQQPAAQAAASPSPEAKTTSAAPTKLVGVQKPSTPVPATATAAKHEPTKTSVAQTTVTQQPAVSAAPKPNVKTVSKSATQGEIATTTAAKTPRVTARTEVAGPPTPPVTSSPSRSQALATNAAFHQSSDVVAESPVQGPPTPVEILNGAKPFTLPERPLVLAPEYLENPTGLETRRTSNEQATADAASEAPTTATANEASTPAAVEKPLWASVGPSSTPLEQAENAEGSSGSNQESLIERLKTKFFSNRPEPRPYMTTEVDLREQIRELGSADSNVYGPPTPGLALDRAALLERIRLAGQGALLPQDTLPAVAAALQRPEMHYHDQGRRDPFDPLLKGLRSGFVSDDLPTVESLRMVGVLRDSKGAMALLEDMEGHSYILRAGDAVANGRVIAVGEQRVLIQVDEYGWTRTVALQLSARGADPSKAMTVTPLQIAPPPTEQTPGQTPGQTPAPSQPTQQPQTTPN